MYDSTKKLHPEFIRDDIHYLGIPLMQMCNEHYSDPRQRQLFKNIIYVGALSCLLQIELEVLKQLLAEQFQGKEKLIAPNIQALQLGIDYVKEHFSWPLPMRLERRDLVKNSIMTTGNSACGLGAVYGGATVCAWYPITPSTSVAEAFEEWCNDYRKTEDGQNNFAIVQAEDELAAMGMVIGANWNGARAFTATSGPGVSLMNEFLGLAYFAEVPAVLIDVQRTGPSTGMPTRTQQSDILEAAYASHGDTKHVLLFPMDPTECFELTADSFDLAEELQTPVIILTDLDLGMNDHMCKPFHWDDTRVFKRGKVYSAELLESMNEKFGRYLDKDGDGIPWRTIPGTHPTKGAYFTRGTSKDEYAVYTESSEAYQRNMDRLLKKWETAKTLVPAPVVHTEPHAPDTGILYFGTSTHAAEEAADMLRNAGHRYDMLRLRAFPFGKEVEEFIRSHKRIFVIEQNRDAQMRSLLMIELNAEPSKLISVLNFDGMPITADTIFHQIVDNNSHK